MTVDYTGHDGLEHCCTHQWTVFFVATQHQRTNGRWVIVVRADREVVAWAAYSPARGSYLNVVLLYGGRHRPIVGHDGTTQGFFRVVRDAIIDDMPPPRCVLWNGG